MNNNTLFFISFIGLTENDVRYMKMTDRQNCGTT